LCFKRIFYTPFHLSDILTLERSFQ